jgi:hypothetical protein
VDGSRAEPGRAAAGRKPTQGAGNFIIGGGRGLFGGDSSSLVISLETGSGAVYLARTSRARRFLTRGGLLSRSTGPELAITFFLRGLGRVPAEVRIGGGLELR